MSNASSFHPFSGNYPSLAPGDFDTAIQILSPGSPKEFSQATMEETFRVLDSELVRNSLTTEQQQVVDELWRVIKMIMNGSLGGTNAPSGGHGHCRDIPAGAAYPQP